MNARRARWGSGGAHVPYRSLVHSSPWRSVSERQRVNRHPADLLRSGERAAVHGQWSAHVCSECSFREAFLVDTPSTTQLRALAFHRVSTTQLKTAAFPSFPNPSLLLVTCRPRMRVGPAYFLTLHVRWAVSGIPSYTGNGVAPSRGGLRRCLSFELQPIVLAERDVLGSNDVLDHRQGQHADGAVISGAPRAYGCDRSVTQAVILVSICGCSAIFDRHSANAYGYVDGCPCRWVVIVIL